MVGISIAASKEWKSILEIYNISQDELKTYPYGEYFIKITDKELISNTGD